MNPRDELIRRAIMHIRNGYALGGKPGESAMARTEATRGVSSSGAGNVGGVRDGGFGGAGVGSLGGSGGGADRLGAGSQISNTFGRTERAAAMDSPNAMNARLGPNAAQAMAGAGMSPDLAADAARSINRRASDVSSANMVGASPQAQVNNASGLNIGDDAFARAMQIISASSPSRTTFSALTGTDVNAGQLQGFAPNQPSPVNFNTAVMGYGSGLPVQNPKTIGQYIEPKAMSAPSYGPLASQVNTSAKGDFLGMPTNRSVQSGTFSGFGMPSSPELSIGDVIAGIQPTSVRGVPVSEASDFYSSMPSPSNVAGLRQPNALASYMGSPTFNTGPRTQMAAAPSMPSIGAMKSAEYQAMADAIKGFTPEQTNQLAFGSAYSTPVPNEVGQMIAGLKAAASNPNISAAQKAKMQADIKALQAMGGIAVSPGSSFAPTPPGFTVNPQTGAITKAPDYNVVAGPYASMDSPVGAFKNISFAMPKSVALTQPGVAANPNYNPMANMMTAAAPAPQGPQNILSSNYQYDGTPANAAYQAPASPQYAYDGTPANAVYQAQEPVSASMPDPIARALASISRNQNFAASNAPDYGRQGDGNRDVNRERSPTRTLLNLGYTQEQIAAMTPEQIKEILKAKTPPTAATAPVVAANGGRIQYKKGGEATTSTSKTTGKGGYTPIALPPMPEYRPYTLPQYDMPSASPLISNFVGSLSQPIPPVQMPQYQSMASPSLNTQASFANPAMGTASSSPSSGAGFGFGVNALRYNPMLMNERPDYALTENNSLSNALRLMRG